MSPLLIVNADDYGLTEAVSAGILRAHRDGIVTSTSVLALAPGFARTGRWLGDHPRLDVGVHLAAVGEDPPLLSAGEIPSLVDRSGRLARSWRQFLPRAAAGRIDPADLAREFGAQVEAVHRLGVAASHLDTHQHLHLWPSVARVVLDLARSAGIPAVRVPRSHRMPLSAGLNRLAAHLSRQASAAGVLFPSDASGVDEAGAMDEARLGRALDGFVARGAPSAELGTHPGEAEDPDRHRYRWGYRWGDELALLTSPAARRSVETRGFSLGGYRGLGGGAGRTPSPSVR